MNNSSARNESSRRSVSVVNSALWAAAGDALGWITELVKDRKEITRRIGSTRVSQPVEWRKSIGGWAGVDVVMPAGTYSDDTQLRLAVSRSIRGDGAFDPEAFAKIELPVWLSYSLGAGLGSKAAAANLSRKGVNWFSNFYSHKDQTYVKGGGNGAAMRIQPHVWSCDIGNLDKCLLDVLRDSLVTHGHPHGFCGAFFHALNLVDTFSDASVPGPDAWRSYIDAFSEIPDRIAGDGRLRSFWLEAWERQSETALKVAMAQTSEGAKRDLDSIVNIIERGQDSCYQDVLQVLGCFDRKFRGSGLKTALAAAALSWVHRANGVERALLEASNEIGSDTDTIATMVGAILGAIASAPAWPIQDREYIVQEALRLEDIREGRKASTFHYPDLIRWKPPGKQSAAFGRYKDGFALLGLGAVDLIGDQFGDGEDVWQWMALSFKQTIIAKRKSIVAGSIQDYQLPGTPAAPEKPRREDLAIQRIEARKRADNVDRMARKAEELLFGKVEDGSGNVEAASDLMSLDALTDEVIRSGFSDEVLGKALNEYIDSNGSLEGAIAFAAIIAKAKLARKKRRR